VATNIDFPSIDWVTVDSGGASGRVKSRVSENGDTVRILELNPKWNEMEWCKKKHIGYVLSGSLGLELRGERPLEVHEGQGFIIPRGCPHRASCKKTTRLFIID
jgi:mannose-6-phosphate isomerase-like protein (cupin superfamily)